MERKQERPAVVTRIVSGFSGFWRLARGSNPLCVGFFAFSLTHLAIAGPVPAPPQDTPIQIAASTPAQAPAEAPKPVALDAPKPAPETPKPEAPKPPTPPAPQVPQVSQAAASQPAQPAPAPAAAPVPPAAHPAPPAPAPAAPAPPAPLQPAAEPTTQEKLQGLQKAADMLIEVNTSLGAPSSPYGQIIYDIALRHSINPQLVAALIHVESAFNPRAVSRKGAYGLMQLLPETARRFGVNRKRDLLDPAKNLEAGVKYLRWLTDRFGGNVHKILAAYNAGEGAVDRFDGIPPYRETQSYVQKIFGLLGFAPDPPPPPPAPAKDSDQPDVVPAGR